MERYKDKSLKVLVTLHNLAAMNEDSARTVDELVKFLNIGESSILEALKSLTGEGFVSEVGGKYYLNYSGTLRILTNYT